MGDFAAGKMLGADGVTHEAIGADNFEQFKADLETGFAKFGLFAEIGPCAGDLMGLGSELLAALYAWKDGGICVYEYTLLPAAELVAGPQVTIGRDLDGSALNLDVATGMLMDDSGPIGELGQYLGKFRNELLSHKLEWADGSWVEISA